MQITTPNICTLPNEILGVICANLDVTQVVGLSRVNRRMHAFVESSDVACVPFRLLPYDRQYRDKVGIIGIVKHINNALPHVHNETYAVDLTKLPKIANLLRYAIICATSNDIRLAAKYSAYGLILVDLLLPIFADTSHDAYYPSIKYLQIYTSGIKAEVEGILAFVKRCPLEVFGIYINPVNLLLVSNPYSFYNVASTYMLMNHISTMKVKRLSSNIPSHVALYDNIASLESLHLAVSVPSVPCQLRELHIYQNEEITHIVNMPNLEFLECSKSAVRIIKANKLKVLRCCATTIEELDCPNLTFMHLTNVMHGAKLNVPSLTHLHTNMHFDRIFANYVFQSVIKMHIAFDNIDAANKFGERVPNWIKIVPNIKYLTCFVAGVTYRINSKIYTATRSVHCTWLPRR